MFRCRVAKQWASMIYEQIHDETTSNNHFFFPTDCWILTGGSLNYESNWFGDKRKVIMTHEPTKKTWKCLRKELQYKKNSRFEIFRQKCFEQNEF